MLPSSVLRGTLLVLVVALLPACGVRFFSSFDGTEVFKDLELQGDLFANRPLVLAVEVNQAYGVPVRIACYYEDREDLSDDEKRVAFQERAIPIGERDLPPSDATSPDEDVTLSSLRFSFSVPQPGNYFVACLTPAAPENGIGLEFELRPAIDAIA